MADRQDRTPISDPAGAGSPPTEPPAGATNPAALSLPRGGGAIRGIGEKFAANPVTGTGGVTIPIPTSPGRSELGPSVSVNYDSGSGNGPFGIGWSLSLPSITRKTDKGLPRYADADESDTFILSGAEDLVPVLVDQGGELQPLSVTRSTEGRMYRVERYRPRVEGLFARIERWTDLDSGAVHWRSVTRDNLTTRYGSSDESRIADPADPGRVFSWLICESYDDRGNAVLYRHRPEDSTGVDASLLHERNRAEASRSANRYLKRIQYGNRTPRQAGEDLAQRTDWMFEVVLDYGEHNADAPTPDEGGDWLCRRDPFSSYRAGFEVRTYRLCQRVLMFHHFPDEADVGSDCLVRSTDLAYRDLRNEPDDRRLGHPLGAFLASVTQAGYRRQPGGGYVRRALPPLELEYSLAEIQDTVRDVEEDSLENLPAGIDGRHWRWIDLDSEGSPGVLSEQGNGWYYKRNLSPLTSGTGAVGNGAMARFGPARAVERVPSLVGGDPQFVDLAGDGTVDLVHTSGPLPGFYERIPERGWAPFTPFTSVPGVAWDDPNLRLVDLTGDGHADLLLTEDEALRWYPSLAEAGFGAPEPSPQGSDEERAPRLVFDDGTQSVYLADLSGDGLADLVRVRNGEVCYWPNLGYGRFGAKVAMDNAPWLDVVDQFDQRRVHLADVDGSGVTDLVYVGADGVRIYLNESGNRWSEAYVLPHTPRFDTATSVAVTDLLGNGTVCLVWSSPLTGDGRRAMRYIDLLGGQKPHLLTRVVNNMGVETEITYAPSTRFYLEDQQRGTPWVTRLPFPVHVVARVETFDRVSQNRFVTRYAYHHGFFDGVERELHGFGMVEQWDTEELASLAPGGALPPASNLDPVSHVPPVLTRTWFHNGAYLGRWRISRLFEHEYYRELGLAEDDLRALLLPDTELPSGLTAEEEREACRSLRGAMLRKEVYGLDGSAQAPQPYAVSERNYTVRQLQPQGPNRYAVYFTHPREGVDLNYERALFDVGGEQRPEPRVSHSLTLALDDFGSALRTAAIGYGRRHEDPDPALTGGDRDKQGQILLTYTENDFSNVVDEADAYRAPLMAESRTWELVRVRPSANRTGVTNLLRFGELGDRVAEAGDGTHDLEYGDVAAAGATEAHPYRRLVEQRRNLFRRNDLTAFSPLGQVESLALPGQSYRLALTPDLLARVFVRHASGQPVENLLPDPAVLLEGKGEDQGGYVALDGAWWIPSGRAFYDPAVNVADSAASAAQELVAARQGFYRPRLLVDPFDQRTGLDYDDDRLLVTRTRDAVGNEVVAENDYRVLQPRLITDPNRNRAEVAFDALGLVVATVLMGKESESLGDLLEDVDADPALADVQAFMADPLTNAAAMLGKATTRVVYDLDRYRRAGQAPSAATLKRETHFQDAGGGQSRIQVSLSYSDGFGREIQKKIQAEAGDAAQRQANVTLPTGDVRPGDLVRDAQGVLVQATTSPRWAGTGRTVFNNKGKPVRQYEPFFSTTHLHEPELEMTEAGVSRVLFYDPVERVIATLHPNHSYQKVVFDPWQQRTYDLNDTIAARGRETGDPRTDPDVAGYVREYFKSQPADWQTWQAQRQSGALGPQELDAATRAALHADTPTVTYLDTLGRPFLTVAHNRFQRNGATVEEQYASRSDLDVEGNQRVLSDARDRVVVRFDYDLLSRPIHQASMEAGERWMMVNAAGNPIRTFDSRQFVRRHTYDGLRRLTGLFVTDNDIERLAERTVYGEAAGDAANHRTRVHQVFDGAGVVTSDAYDFKGNILRSRRDLRPDYRNPVDWQQSPTANDGSFTSRTTYDALNRPITVTTPDGSVYRPSFNEAGLLETVAVNLRGAPASTPFITNVDYTAKGFRRRIAYGNGALATYRRDPLTCRVIRLTTTRPSNPDATAAQIFQDPTIVQDLAYTYDPIGNITHVEDAAHKTVFHNNEQVDAVASYTYDALYRLVEAHGREQIGQTAISLSPADGTYRDYPFAGLAAHPNDLQALRNYTERYEYDAVGNIEALRHVANGGNWTRSYDYSETSLLEAGQPSNRLTSTTLANGANQTEPYTYDGHGNVSAMPHLSRLAWDFEDQLREADLGGGGTAYYVYGTSGERVRKVIDAQNGTRRKERLYLGGFEIYREYNGDGSTVTLERESLQVMDDKQRVALVETPTVENGSAVNAPEPLQRYQMGNQLESVCVELAEDGALISYEEYHPYGTTALQAGRRAAEVSLKRYRYTSIERDDETGLSYHSARYYAPWLGRWANCDPAGTRAGPNLYAYGGANPVSRRDTSGMDSEWCIFCNPFSDDVEFAPKQFLKEEVAPRAVGALKAGAGLAGMAAGAALCDTGIGCAIGGPLIVVSADYGGSGLAQAWHGSPQPTAVGYVAGPKAQEIQGQVVEAAGFAFAFADAAATATVNRLARKEATSTSATSTAAKTAETGHVGASAKGGGPQGNRLSVADAGADKCVGNVCAIMKNQELKAGPASGYTTSEIEREFSTNLGRLKSGLANPKVATPERAVRTIEEITGLKAVNPKSPVNFGAAQGEGQYAVFFNESHVVYAKLGPGGRVSILDPNVGKGFGSWSDFVKYAETKPTLYGANPAKSNKAFLFKEPKE